MNKAVDCIQIKRDGARALMAKLDALTPEQRREYWDRRSREFATEIRDAKAARAAAGLPEFEPDPGGLASADEGRKTFDCVEMKRQGALRVRAMLDGMTREEQIAYWARRSRELEEQLRQAKREHAATKPS